MSREHRRTDGVRTRVFAPVRRLSDIVWQRWLVYAVFGTPFIAALLHAPALASRDRRGAVLVLCRTRCGSPLPLGDRNQAFGDHRLRRLGAGARLGHAGSSVDRILFLLFASLVSRPARWEGSRCGVASELAATTHPEGLFFLVGAMGLRNHDDAQVRAGLARHRDHGGPLHYFCLATGFVYVAPSCSRIATSHCSMADTFQNTQGAFYAMTIPRRWRSHWRDTTPFVCSRRAAS